MGTGDLETEFKEAQKLANEDIFMRFRYLPYDLDRSLNAVIYAGQGIEKYPSWNVFRLQ